MKKLMIVSLSLIAMIGCVKPNPEAGKQIITQNPSSGLYSTNIAPQFVVDTQKIEQVQGKIDQGLTTATTLNGMTAGFNPYAAPIQGGIDVAKTVEVAIPTIFAALSGLLAFFKNKTAKVQTAAAAQLAKSPTNEHAIANASTPEVAAAIAQHAAEAQEVIPVVATPTKT